MASGWAVASCVALGLAAASLVGAGDALGGAEGPARALGALLVALAFLSWAAALPAAAHGSRGAVAALLGNALVLGLLRGLLLAWECLGCASLATAGPLALGLLLAAAGAGAAYALVPELRRRRGPVQLGYALALTLPALLLTGFLALV